MCLLRPAGATSSTEHSEESGTAEKAGRMWYPKILRRSIVRSSEHSAETFNVIIMRQVWLRARFHVWKHEENFVDSVKEKKLRTLYFPQFLR